MEHAFLLQPGLWRAEGEFFDAVGNLTGVEGTAEVRHYPEKWVYEGVLRTLTPAPQETRTLYEIHPFAPGAFATHWSSNSATLGTLRGRFLIVGDAILSSYESATGRYRGQDTLLQRDARRYSARGALFDGARLLSAWSVELLRSA
ncbi:MAG: hypothetical protein EPO27_00270 [Betaproteobacteria bacterium]|nr:MAG: hypothetical protein EPO27_00270 [Betaproteobacteria bacterium]